MGWNGSGAITLLYDWTADRDAGIPDAYISADKFDVYMEDLAGAIENTLARDGQNRPSTNINWNAHRIENLGAPTGPLHAVNANSVSLSLFGGTTTGSASNYTIPNTYLSSVAAGTTVRMIANHTNTGAATLTVSGGVLGSTAIVRADGSSALTGGEIVSGDFFEVAYDGTSWVLIHSPVEQTGDFVDGTVTVGVNDSIAGTFIAYGGGDTQVGGELRLHNANDTDTTSEYWGVRSTASNGNLDVFRQGAATADMYVRQTDGGLVLPPGLLEVGAPDTTAGILSLWGGATGSSQGGELRVYNDDSNDATVDYYRVEALTGNLVIARGTGSADVTLNTSGEATFANAATFSSTATLSGDATFGASVIGHPAQIAVPGGRLTLTSGEPYPYTTAMTKTAMYYTPHDHNMIALYNGTTWVTFEFSELTNTFSDATTNPAAVSTVAHQVHDFFVWDDSGTIRLSRGPAWTDVTTRSTGTALTRVDGVLVNNAAITNGPAANRGRYVGSMYTDSSGNCHFRPFTNAVSAGDQTVWIGYWNQYNRIDLPFYMRWNTGSYTYATNTYRFMKNDSTYRVVVITGDDDGAAADVHHMFVSQYGVGGARAAINWGIDNATQQFGQRYTISQQDAVTTNPCGGALRFTLGAHSLYPIETAPTATYTGYLSDSNVQGHMEM